MGVRYNPQAGDVIGNNGAVFITQTHQKGRNWFGDFYCGLCGKIFNTRITDVRNNRTKSCGCLKKSSCQKVGMANKGKIGFDIKYKEGDFVGPFNILLIKRLPKEETGSKAIFKCSFCGSSFTTKPYYVSTGHTSSCGCISSKGEEKISLFLKKMGIDFEKQKTFKGCLSKNQNLLRFDFYLPYYNLLIEYDGEQHFISRENGYFSKDNLIEVQERDQLKNTWAKENNIILKRISFLDYEKISEDFLWRLINENN